MLLRNRESIGKHLGFTGQAGLTPRKRHAPCHWLWDDLIWYDRIVLSISPLLSVRDWGDLAVGPSLLACPSYSSPGRRTSLLWLNRLSRDPINHHLHSPAPSPFTNAPSSHIGTLPFTHALHGSPMWTHKCEQDAPTALLPPLPSYPQPAHQSTHTHTHKHTLRHPWALFPSHLIRPEQTAITVCTLVPISPPLSFLICWLAGSTTTYWPETKPHYPVDPGALCVHLSECRQSLHPPNSI